MQNFSVSYVVYRGDSSEVLTEGTTTIPSSNGRLGAENAIKSMYGNGNRVIIRSVFLSN